MKMYHGDNQIDVNPSKVDEMLMKGWTLEQPSPSKRKAKSKATETVEENDNGES